MMNLPVTFQLLIMSLLIHAKNAHKASGACISCLQKHDKASAANNINNVTIFHITHSILGSGC